LPVVAFGGLVGTPTVMALLSCDLCAVRRPAQEVQIGVATGPHDSVTKFCTSPAKSYNEENDYNNAEFILFPSFKRMHTQREKNTQLAFSSISLFVIHPNLLHFTFTTAE
jgi:hypothetical protein